MSPFLDLVAVALESNSENSAVSLIAADLADQVAVTMGKWLAEEMCVVIVSSESLMVSAHDQQLINAPYKILHALLREQAHSLIVGLVTTLAARSSGVPLCDRRGFLEWMRREALYGT